MRRPTAVVALLLLVRLGAWAQTEWMGIYLRGAKIGYSSFVAVDAQVAGKPGRQQTSTMVIDAKMLGSGLEMRSDSTSWYDAKGQPVRMRFVTASGGRKQTVDATFAGAKITAKIDNNGAKSTKTIAIPSGARITDDATTMLMGEKAPPVGRQLDFYVLDPTTVSLVKNSVRYEGPTRVLVKGAETSAVAISVIDPRAVSKVYMSAKGDLLKVTGPFGMEMYPERKEVATKLDSSASGDLAFLTSLRPEPALERPLETTRLTLSISGIDLERVPSDAHQTVKRDGETWTVEIHPLAIAADKSKTVAEAAAEQPQWVKPSLNMPSDSATFKNLARQIAGDETNVVRVVDKVKRHVAAIMRPNAGIGVLRDAGEILKTREGVCRDYAVLAATILRAAGVPTRLATGLVGEGGEFFYHAWVEAWTGAGWLACDPTRLQTTVSASHFKLAQGNVEEATLFFALTDAKVKIVDVQYRGS